MKPFQIQDDIPIHVLINVLTVFNHSMFCIALSVLITIKIVFSEALYIKLYRI